MMATAAGQKVPVIQSQVKSFLQRLDVVYLQIQIQTRNAKYLVASLVTYPAEMEVPPDNFLSLFLPCVGISEGSGFAVLMLRRLRFLGADIPTRMDPAAILT